MLKKETLLELNEKYKNSDDILGKNIMTMTNRVNSSRALMVSNNLDQTLVLLKPEVPRVSTNYENLIGEYSSAYYRSHTDFEIVDKIEKFKTKEGHIYTFIVYDKINKKYDIITKSIGECLTENYAYLYDNKKLDSYDVGDEIDTGEVLYKSTSFDDYMNYRYGTNLKCMYIIDDKTIEDAIVISESAAKKLYSVELETIRMSLNDNDIFINLYGNQDEYKAFPDVGELIKNKTLAVKRRIIYSQSLYDLNSENIRKKLKTDTPCYISCNNECDVVDINIFCNKELDELNECNYNKQLLKYYKNELRYHKEIVEKLGSLIKSGKKVSDDLDYMYKRSLDTLDPNAKWKDSNGNIFNNMIIEFTVKKICGVGVGSKLTGRYGDKGVISAILPDDEMPMLETGERVEMLCNALGIVNRLNASQLYEVELNFIVNRIVERMQQTDDLEEKEKLIFPLLIDINPTHKAYYEMYKNFSHEDKINFMNAVEKDKLVIHQPPMYGNIQFDQLAYIYDKYNIELYTCYVNKFGRKIKMMNKMVAAEKYVLKLKHTPLSKTTIRSTGYLNSKDLPFKSAKNNRNLIQKTAVRIGEMEYTNLLCNMRPELLRDLSMIYSTSTQARRDSGQLFENNVLEEEDIVISDNANNRAAEILSVYLKSIGIGIEFIDEDTEDEILCTEIMDESIDEDDEE